jgi:hypothetical protein
LLSVLARAHLRLLLRGTLEPADRVLEAAAQAQDLADLERRLALLT